MQHGGGRRVENHKNRDISAGGLKTRDWKRQDWKTWDQIAKVEKTGLENTGPKRMDGNRRTGKTRDHISRGGKGGTAWKTREHHAHG